jgi:hemoglobin-like flavoprotein
MILPPRELTTNGNFWPRKDVILSSRREAWLGLSTIVLLQQTLNDVLPQADALAQAFYQRLFELDPSLQFLFTHDPAEQRRKFMDMLASLIQGLDRLHTVLPEIYQLGLRHAQYGVKPEHYATAGVALLWALDQTLGQPMPEQTRSAWIEAYDLLTTAMQAAGSSPIPQD